LIKARKQDVARLEDISRELNHGLALLMSDKYQIMVPTTLNGTDGFTAGYYPGEKYAKIVKEIGNDLVPMFTAIKELKKLLEPEAAADPVTGNKLFEQE
jgi:hypothetical protein